RGHAQLHVPGADRGSAGGRPNRPVRAGLHGVRAADRGGAVPARRRDGGHLGAHVPAAAPAGAAPARPAAGCRPGAGQGPGQGPRAPVPELRRVRGRAARGAGRGPAPAGAGTGPPGHLASGDGRRPGPRAARPGCRARRLGTPPRHPPPPPRPPRRPTPLQLALAVAALLVVAGVILAAVPRSTPGPGTAGPARSSTPAVRPSSHPARPHPARPHPARPHPARTRPVRPRPVRPRARSKPPATEFTVCVDPVDTCGLAQMQTKPSTVLLSGDGSGLMMSVRWSGWGSPVATGVGTYELDNCVPSCSQGKYRPSPATITLSGLTPY